MNYKVTEEDVRREIASIKAQGKKVINKVWGWEYWIVNNDKYCGKLLYILPGYKSSLHYHRVKHETFMVLAGAVMIEMEDFMGDPTLFFVDILRPWCHDSIELEPDTPHRFRALDGPAIVAEFSTPHDDADVVRLEKSSRIL